MVHPLDIELPPEFRADPITAQNMDRLIRAVVSWKDIDKLDQTIANPPTQAEVQDISDKIDEMLTAMQGE